MKKKVAQLLYKALKSGRFTKIKHKLKQKKNDGTICHCVEGVLCEVFRDEFPEVTLPETLEEDGYVKIAGECFSAPRIVKLWSGIKDGELMCMNDETDLSFSEIADKIKEDYENL